MASLVRGNKMINDMGTFFSNLLIRDKTWRHPAATSSTRTITRSDPSLAESKRP
jgi:hypothetical protein